jgi:phosphoribosyl 1,2-cyclic phosphodiesterase
VIRIAIIASGSSGNCIYISSDDTHLLVDAGVSCKRIEEGLIGFGINPDELCGILVTHEHSDHIKGIGTFVKKHKIPVYGTIETLAAMKRSQCAKAVPMELMIHTIANSSFNIGDIAITVTETSHDAAHSVCYRFENSAGIIAMATDLGKYDDRIISHLSGADILYLESNYDHEMLMVGNYPYYLKCRIDGDLGHLSNDCSAELIEKVLHPGLKHVILAHLSHENNYPEIAYRTHLNMINDAWSFKSAKPTLDVALRDVPSVAYEITEENFSYEENNNNCCG